MGRFTMEQLYISHTANTIPVDNLVSGDLRSQGISTHGIDHISQNILSLASEELTLGINIEQNSCHFADTMKYNG